MASLNLVDSGGVSHADLLQGTTNLQARISKLQASGIIPSPLPSSEGNDGTRALRAVMPAYFADPRTAPTPGLWNTASNVAVNRMTTENFANYDFRVPLSQFGAPVLVIYGDSDPFGMRMGQRTAESFSPHILTYKVLKHCGHVPWVECKSDFDATLFGFLDVFAKP